MASGRPILKHFPRYSDSHRPPALCLSSSSSRHAGHSPTRLASFASSSMSTQPPSPSPFPFASSTLNSPHVHFPPTPSLTSTHPAHSPTTYDRAPIAISPNACSLPERGGRVFHGQYTPSIHARRRHPKGSYFHPAAYEACERELLDDGSPPTTSPLSPPPLVADLTSESDSDGYASPDAPSPPGPSLQVGIASDPRYALMFWNHHEGSYPPTPHAPRIPYTPSQEDFQHASEFLPHPNAESKRSRAKGRDQEREPRRPRRVQPVRSSSEASLDGCLGGF